MIFPIEVQIEVLNLVAAKDHSKSVLIPNWRIVIVGDKILNEIVANSNEMKRGVDTSIAKMSFVMSKAKQNFHFRIS